MQIIPQSDYAIELFNNNAGLGTDKSVSAAVLKAIHNLTQNVSNTPNTTDLNPISTDHEANDVSALSDTKLLFGNQKNASTSIVLLGEAHNNIDDINRATTFINTINHGDLTPTLVLFERGMNYNTPAGVQVIREINLTSVTSGNFGLGLTAKQRSMVVAGYLALIIGSGNQLDINKFLAFYGANHKDILLYFEYFSRHTVPYIQKTTRNLVFVRSHV